jgi:hypothetical protein
MLSMHQMKSSCVLIPIPMAIGEKSKESATPHIAGMLPQLLNKTKVPNNL